MKAIKCFGPKNAKVIPDAPVPEAPADYLLVKVIAVALNPTDWKHIDFIAQPDYNHTVGCDYAGIVVSVGSAVTKSFQPGDRIAGFSHGSKHEDPSSGCFAEYAKVKGDIQLKIPENISFEEAASWPTGINTTGQGMYGPDGLGLPEPEQQQQQQSATAEKVPVLIYGGSTNTGLWAIQYAKLSGLRVITTCSEKNFEAVKALGADEVFDYRDEKCGEKIREVTKNGLKFAFDCVSEGNSMEVCCSSSSWAAAAVLVRNISDNQPPSKTTFPPCRLQQHYARYANLLHFASDLCQSIKQRWVWSSIQRSTSRRIPTQRRQDVLHHRLLGEWGRLHFLWKLPVCETTGL